MILAGFFIFCLTASCMGPIFGSYHPLGADPAILVIVISVVFVVFGFYMLFKVKDLRKELLEAKRANEKTWGVFDGMRAFESAADDAVQGLKDNGDRQTAKKAIEDAGSRVKDEIAAMRNEYGGKSESYDLTKWVRLMVGSAIVCIIGFTILCSVLVLAYYPQGWAREDNLVALMTVFAAVITVVFVVFGFFLIAKANEMKGELQEARKANEDIRKLRDDAEAKIEAVAERAAKRAFEESNRRIAEEADKAYLESEKRIEVEGLIHQGLMSSKDGRLEDAIAAYDRAIALDPQHGNAHNLRGVVLGKLGKLDEALAAYDKAIASGTAKASSSYNRACAHARLFANSGDTERRVKALSDLGVAIRLDGKYKLMARKDDAFKALWNDPEFKKLTEE
ncbi:MAG: tetratricopeptide repeat protein, partial [Candidatus Brocadiia bacterium]